MVLVNEKEVCLNKADFTNYQDKKKKVEEILEKNGYQRNAFQVFQDEKNKIVMGKISEIVTDTLEVYQVLLNKEDKEALEYFEKSAETFTKEILDSRFKAFQELIKKGYEVEKMDNWNLQNIVESLALSKILRKIKKWEEF